MANLEPTPELIATARRVKAGECSVPAGASAYAAADDWLRTLIREDLVTLFRVHDRHLRDDYWTLTDAGRVWLAEHDTTTKD